MSNENEMDDCVVANGKAKDINGAAGDASIIDDEGDEDVEMDEADELLQQLTTGNTLKRPSDSDMEAQPSKSARLAEDDFMGRFGTLKENYYTKRIDVSENCIHEVVCPIGVNAELVDRQTEPAKKYPFPLDVFQKKSINCIDNNQSVLVSAHTSAGKTVVALYAIALALKNKQRVIYTSPIKALSNQKYRELYKEFGDVGLMTGDVTINPEASCIVMTTEILRSMLYRGSSLMHEIGWVVFDEIHYMRDKERGVVWEETIIMLADSVHFVFLSATIPNALQFASWICALHHQPCHVVYTDYRPTPLRHFVYPVGAPGLYEVVGVDGVFRQNKLAEAMSHLSTSDSVDAATREGPRRNDPAMEGDPRNVLTIIRTIQEKDLLPCIIFSFSRKECENYAKSLKDMDFIKDSGIKSVIKTIFNNAVECLSEEDRSLPQVTSVLPHLLRGIGVHHSGLLPILKEVIEILFGEGFIKVCFLPFGLLFGYGAVVSYDRSQNPDPNKPGFVYKVSVLLKLDAELARSGPITVERLQPPPNGRVAWTAEAVPVLLENITKISRIKIKMPPAHNLQSPESRKAIVGNVNEAIKRVGKVEELDPITTMKIMDKSFIEDFKRLQQSEQRYKSHELKNDPNFKKLYHQFEQKEHMKQELAELRQEFKKAQSETLLADLEARKRVLRRLDYCSEGDIITQKGRVACEISAADELLLTEMIFDNVFRNLDAATSAALLSCFICQEKGNTPKLAEVLSGCLRTMQGFARRIAQATKDSLMEIDEDEYIDSFKPQMMDVVYSWIQGKSFSEICGENSELFEGSIIRCFRRLEELLRQMVGAAKSMGSENMEQTFEEARLKLKRDIVFAASLYL
uniref:Helicase ATP-binding domain-containing protein n=1 Tax=Panagrolaimus sp. ES5 TaxID=591445 RepID=A0AC34F163_9BILA